MWSMTGLRLITYTHIVWRVSVVVLIGHRGVCEKGTAAFSTMTENLLDIKLAIRRYRCLP